MKRAGVQERERWLFEIAESQGGYFTAQQALFANYSYRLQLYHKNRGNWLHIDRGIYRLRNFPHSSREDLIRQSLLSFDRKGESQAVFSHETALAFHEIGDFMPARIHITLPPSYRKKNFAGCIVYRAVLPDEDVGKHGCFRVTTPLRSLFDAYQSHAAPDHLERAILDAFSRGVIRMDQISVKGTTGPMEKFLEYVHALEQQLIHKTSTFTSSQRTNLNAFPVDRVAKEIFWDYDVSVEEMKSLLHDERSDKRLWAAGRILKYARWEDARRLLNMKDLEEVLPKVDIPHGKRRALENALEIWRNAE